MAPWLTGRTSTDERAKQVEVPNVTTTSDLSNADVSGTGRSSCYFTAPAVSPPTMYFCRL